MLKNLSYALIAGVLLTACSGSETNNAETQETPAAEVATTEEAPASTLNEDLKAKLDMIIANNMLVPISIISDLKQDGKSLYHPEYVNSLDNVEKYDNEFSKALNFGVYGVDIIYNISHNHNEEVASYKDKTQEMAKSLGLESFYVQEDMNAFKEASKDDQQVSKFVFDEYHKIDEYLVSHDRFETMTLMMAGGIIESMFFTGKSIEEYGMSDLKYSLLLNERKTLGELVDLLGEFKSNDKDQALKAELSKLHESFSSFSAKEDLTAEKIKMLDDQVFELRNKIINNQI